MPNLPNDSARSARVRGLAQIAQMLAKSPEVRPELVDDLRSQIDGGAYVNEKNLDLAIYRLLKDILK